MENEIINPPFGMTDEKFASLTERRMEFNARVELLANTAVSLPDENAWDRIDRQVIELARPRTPLYRAFVDAVGDTSVELEDEFYSYHNSVGAMQGVETRDFTNEHRYGRVSAEKMTVPIPVYSAGYQLGRREAGRLSRNGSNMSALHASTAIYAVTDMLEGLILTGSTMTASGSTAKGLSNHDAIVDVSVDISGSGTTALATANGGDWQKVLTDTLGALDNQNMPVDNLTLIANPGDWLHAELAKFSNTDPQRIADYIRGAGNIRNVVTSPKVTAGTCYFVDLRRDYFRVPVADPLSLRLAGRTDERDPFTYVAEAVTGFAIVQNGNGKTAGAKVVTS